MDMKLTNIASLTCGSLLIISQIANAQNGGAGQGGANGYMALAAYEEVTSANNRELASSIYNWYVELRASEARKYIFNGQMKAELKTLFSKSQTELATIFAQFPNESQFIKDLHERGLLKEIDNSPFEESEKCLDENGMERALTTDNLILGGKICVSPRKIAEDFIGSKEEFIKRPEFKRADTGRSPDLNSWAKYLYLTGPRNPSDLGLSKLPYALFKPWIKGLFVHDYSRHLFGNRDQNHKLAAAVMKSSFEAMNLQTTNFSTRFILNNDSLKPDQALFYVTIDSDNLAKDCDQYFSIRVDGRAATEVRWNTMTPIYERNLFLFGNSPTSDSSVLFSIARKPKETIEKIPILDAFVAPFVVKAPSCNWKQVGIKLYDHQQNYIYSTEFGELDYNDEYNSYDFTKTFLRLGGTTPFRVRE